MKPTVREALDKLVAHGSANQIAEYLEQEGVTGHRSSASTCVIAEYVRTTAEALRARVVPTGELVTHYPDGTNSIKCFPGRIEWRGYDGEEHAVPIPGELDRLANSFDRGDFPALVRRIKSEAGGPSCGDDTVDHVVDTKG